MSLTGHLRIMISAVKYLLWNVRENKCNRVLLSKFLQTISKGFAGFHSMTLRMALLRFSKDSEVETMNKIWINKVSYRSFRGTLSELPNSQGKRKKEKKKALELRFQLKTPEALHPVEYFLGDNPITNLNSFLWYINYVCYLYVRPL